MSGLSAIDCRRLTAGLVVITFVVIALGGVIRIYDAGESCPDWPTCFGTLGFDVSEAEQEAWYEANPDEIDSRGAGIDTRLSKSSPSGLIACSRVQYWGHWYWLAGCL